VGTVHTDKELTMTGTQTRHQREQCYQDEKIRDRLARPAKTSAIFQANTCHTLREIYSAR
jgi:hypothetical protein